MNETVIRTIRSFVKREGRLTRGQQQAIDELWPVYGVDYTEQPPELNKLFGREAETVLEIGFGNGDSLWQMAQAQPEKNFFGIEVHRPGVGHLLHLIDTSGCRNIRVSNHDAVEVLEHQIADYSLDKIQLFFPDPWHKKKHHKRRIVQPAFVQLVAQKLKPGGIFHLATDWENYAEHMLRTLNSCDRFENLSTDNSYVDKPVERPITKFETRGQCLGHSVWDLLFKTQQSANTRESTQD